MTLFYPHDSDKRNISISEKITLILIKGENEKHILVRLGVFKVSFHNSAESSSNIKIK